MNQPMALSKYVEAVQKEYKPYQDKHCAKDQLTAVQDTICELEREIYGKDAFTKQEIQEQNQKVCKFAMLCLRLDGTIGREMAKEQEQTMQM